MASMTITVADADVPRILDAFNAVYGIPKTPAAVKQNLVNHIKQTVKNYEGLSAGKQAKQVAEDDADNINVGYQ